MLAILFIATPLVTHAQGVNPVLNILGELLFTWLQALTWLVSKLIDVLILFAQYNTFYNHPIVLTGWNLVIQIANMMFLVALLVIAAGTVLNVQNYRYSRLLGNVILMALLVNFSRLIAGFFIQFSQVVMLTFVNSFKEALYGNFATMFGLDKVFQFASTNTDAIKGAADIIIAMIVSMMFMVMAGGTIAAFVAIVVFRIVTLWVLLIMSPLAYALAILPQTKKYADEWWSEFTKNLVSGPVIAFYLWLALAIVSQYSVDNPAQGWLPGADIRSASAINFSNQFLSLGNIISFIVAMTFLSLGLKQATSASGAAGEWAKKLNGGVGGALGFVAGANLVRDRITRPVQGYWALRQKRNDEKVRNRTIDLDAKVGELNNRTIGQVGRAKSAATAYAGAIGRGAVTQTKNWVQGKQTLSPSQVFEQAEQASDAAAILGSEDYQRRWKRVNDNKEAQDYRRAQLEDLTKLSTEQLLGRASTMTGGAVLPYALALAQRRDARKYGKDKELEAIHARAGALEGPNADKYREQLIELDSAMASKAFYGGVLDASGKLTEAFTKALLKDLSLTKLLTPGQLETIKKDNGAFINYIHKNSRNAKEFKTAVENINEDYRGDVTKNIDMTGQDLERRKMVASTTGHWGQAFKDKRADGSFGFREILQPNGSMSSEGTEEMKALREYAKDNKKKFIESLSVASSKDTDLVYALRDTLKVKDYDAIAEKSDYHRAAIDEGISEAYKKSKEQAFEKSKDPADLEGTYDPKNDNFNAQETLRRSAYKVSGGKKILHNLFGPKEAEGVAMFNRMMQGLKAADVKNTGKNAAFDEKSPIYNTPQVKKLRSTILKAMGSKMSVKEVAELSTLGSDQYIIAEKAIAEVLTDDIKKYIYMTKNQYESAIQGLPPEKRKEAARARAYDANETTSEMIS